MCQVVLTAALCTKSGKALLARQFVEMTRLRVEGLLSAFPKLIASEQASASAGSGGSSKQHTFVETDNVRYLYLPLEGALFLLLITNKGSNIVEDLDTLRLISRVLPEQIGVGVALNEESVSSKSFEILFALDEVVASGGYREEITLHQVRRPPVCVLACAKLVLTAAPAPPSPRPPLHNATGPR